VEQRRPDEFLLAEHQLERCPATAAFSIDVRELRSDRRQPTVSRELLK
jgi:hypothetical protein